MGLTNPPWLRGKETLGQPTCASRRPTQGLLFRPNQVVNRVGDFLLRCLPSSNVESTVNRAPSLCCGIRQVVQRFTVRDLRFTFKGSARCAQLLSGWKRTKRSEPSLQKDQASGLALISLTVEPGAWKTRHSFRPATSKTCRFMHPPVIGGERLAASFEAGKWDALGGPTWKPFTSLSASWPFFTWPSRAWPGADEQAAKSFRGERRQLNISCQGRLPSPAIQRPPRGVERDTRRRNPCPFPGVALQAKGECESNRRRQSGKNFSSRPTAGSP